VNYHYYKVIIPDRGICLGCIPDGFNGKDMIVHNGLEITSTNLNNPDLVEISEEEHYKISDRIKGHPLLKLTY
jgi:hypothetical protein